MKTNVGLMLLLTIVSAFSFTDVTYYNSAISQNNSFRVFTPLTYNPNDLSKRYPVIYFLHGCRGSHTYGDNMFMTYGSLGLSTPTVNSAWGSANNYRAPYNPEFENYSDTAEVIIIACNGNFAGGGCAAWVGSPTTTNLAAFFKVLMDTVDRRYNTIATSSGRAITGISLGGYAACFIAGNMPEYFSSASEFCRSPGPFAFSISGGLSTNPDCNDYWRNYRFLPFRTSTNRWDYLQHYTREMSFIMAGATPEAEFEYTQGLCHYAANPHKQFDFHRKYFTNGAVNISSPSYINTYPSFDYNGYSVSSNKRDSGYIYLKDITPNGFGVYTRRTLPYVTPFDSVNITVTTNNSLTPSASYVVNRYDYKKDTVISENKTSDAAGRLTVSITDPYGQEIGIVGNGLTTSVNMLQNSFNEMFFVQSEVDTSISIDVVNLSNSSTTVTFTTSTDNVNLFTLSNTTKTVTIPAKKRMHIDNLVNIRASIVAFPGNIGYLKVKQSIEGVIQPKEYLLQVKVLINVNRLAVGNYSILDGRSESLLGTTFTIGTGNGNGIADSGEIISIGITPPEAASRGDNLGFRPSVPCFSSHPDFSVVNVKTFTRENRFYHLVQMRVNRSITLAKPALVIFQTKFQWNESNQGGIDNKSVQNYKETYHLLAFPKEVPKVEQYSFSKSKPLLTITPNPFNGATTFYINLPNHSKEVNLSIYNLQGQKISDLTKFIRNGKLFWNGTNIKGNTIPEGLYLARIICDGQSAAVKMILTK